MKKLITMLMIAFTVCSVQAQEKILKEMDAKNISKSDVPGPVIQQAEKDFPNASPFQFYNIGETSISSNWKISESVDFSESDKIDHYVVEMKGKDAYYHALYDAKGKLLMSREWQKDAALPTAVSRVVVQQYPGVALKKDEHSKVIDHGKKKEYYVVTLANGKKLTVLPDGTLAKK